MPLKHPLISGILAVICLGLFLILHHNSYTPLPDKLSETDIATEMERHIRSAHSDLTTALNSDKKVDILDAQELNLLVQNGEHYDYWHVHSEDLTDRAFFYEPGQGFYSLKPSDEVFYILVIKEAPNKVYRYICFVNDYLNLPRSIIKYEEAHGLTLSRRGFYARFPWVMTTLYLLTHVFVVLFITYFALRLWPQKPLFAALVWVLFVTAFRILLQRGQIGLNCFWPEAFSLRYMEWLINAVLAYAFLFLTSSLPPSDIEKSETRIIKLWLTCGIYSAILISLFLQSHICIKLHSVILLFEKFDGLNTLFIYEGALLVAITFWTFLAARKLFPLIKKIDRYTRLIAFLISVLLVTILFWTSMNTIYIVTVLLTASIFILVIDLYIDSTHKSSIQWQFALVCLFSLNISLLSAVSREETHKRATISSLAQILTQMEEHREEVPNLSFLSYDKSSDLLLSNSSSPIGINEYGDLVLKLDNRSVSYFRINQDYEAPLNLRHLEIQRLGVGNDGSSISLFTLRNRIKLQKGTWLGKAYLDFPFSLLLWNSFTKAFLCLFLIWLACQSALFVVKSEKIHTHRIKTSSYESRITLLVFMGLTSLFLVLIGFHLIQPDVKNSEIGLKEIDYGATQLLSSKESSFPVLRFNKSHDQVHNLAWYDDKNWYTSHFDQSLFPRKPLLKMDEMINESQLTLNGTQGYGVLLERKSRTYSERLSSLESKSTVYLNFSCTFFVLICALSFLCVQLFTAPLRRLRNLTGENLSAAIKDPVEWGKEDEIGGLIKQFNKILNYRIDQANQRVKTEREGAWKEMAKQVAHEIKNPLTPMKLSLQHLQSRMKEGEVSDEVSGIAKKVSNTLIQQIDNLTNIANSFSTFARLPEPRFEITNLNLLLTQVHDLFENHRTIDFNLYVPIDDVDVWADPNQLVQVFNNVIKNSIQAIPGSRQGYIEIRLSEEDDHAIIEFVDNGQGIDEKLQDKVFSPNFTTKNSGTGLGLAISHKIIETHNGSIDFAPNIGLGTTFYIKLKKFEKDVEA